MVTTLLAVLVATAPVDVPAPPAPSPVLAPLAPRVTFVVGLVLGAAGLVVSSVGTWQAGTRRTDGWSDAAVLQARANEVGGAMLAATGVVLICLATIAWNFEDLHANSNGLPLVAGLRW